MTNWENKTLFIEDNLYVLRGMDTATVDLVYLDPPFNSKKHYSAPIGSKAAGSQFKDAWTLSDTDLVEHQGLKERHPGLYAVISAAGSAHSQGMKSYLIMMALRLMELQRVLKPTGSLYLHCDPTASHYLKLTCDAIFGAAHFRNEIVWCYTGPGSAHIKQFNRKHDTLFWYTKGKEWVFNKDAVRIPHKKPIGAGGTSAKWAKNKKAAAALATRYKKGKVPETWWPDFTPVGRRKKERIGYPTQKPMALLRRILEASSHEGDVVLDPFCGCATTLVTADQLQRQWVGIDLSPKAGELIQKRLADDQGPLFRDLHVRTDTPQRTDLGPPLMAAEQREYKRVLYGLQVGRCNGCHTHFEQLTHLQMDHIVARARGGTDHKHNFQLLCGHCNSVKGTKTQAEFVALISRKRKDFSWL